MYYFTYFLGFLVGKKLRFKRRDSLIVSDTSDLIDNDAQLNDRETFKCSPILKDLRKQKYESRGS